MIENLYKSNKMKIATSVAVLLMRNVRLFPAFAGVTMDGEP